MAFNGSDTETSVDQKHPNGINKTVSRSYYQDQNENNQDALNRLGTAGSINMPPELFEKLYLAPKNEVKGELRNTFGNPTPLALAGYILSITPLSCDLMGWRGTSSSGAASTGVYIFLGGLLMILGSVGEWLIGNTFPFVVFGTFGGPALRDHSALSNLIYLHLMLGGFWFALGATLIPWFNAYGAYAVDFIEDISSMGNSGSPLGLHSPDFNSSFAFFLLFMAMISLVFLICSLRTNVVYFVIFLSFILGFSCLAGAHWNLALVFKNASNADAATVAANLFKVSGAFFFVASMAGWWIFCAIMLASLDFPFQIPVGDLSTLIKGRSEKKRTESAA